MSRGQSPPRWRVYLAIARVWHLPTVWTNCLAGATLATGEAPPVSLIWAALAASCFFTGGVCLNEAFDAEHDRRARLDRPIPNGLIDAKHALLIGVVLIAAGEALLCWISGRAAGVGLILAYLIAHYSLFHNSDPLSPLVIALCRACVYLMSAAAVGAEALGHVLSGAAALTGYVITLSLLAKYDLAPGRVGAVLIAGIALLDTATIVSATGRWDVAALAAGGFPLALALQWFAPRVSA